MHFMNSNPQKKAVAQSTRVSLYTLQGTCIVAAWGHSDICGVIKQNQSEVGQIQF